MDNSEILRQLNHIASTLTENDCEHWTESVISAVNESGRNEDLALWPDSYKAVITSRAIFSFYESKTVSDIEDEKYILNMLTYIADTIFDYNSIGWENSLKESLNELSLIRSNRSFLIMTISYAIAKYIISH